MQRKIGAIQPKESKNNSSETSPNLESRIQSLGSGKPMPEPVRSYFEPRFGYDFSDVRVHDNSNAADTARTVNAKAFTFGKDIVFGEGEHSPETNTGRQLLAHELTHVVQQKTFLSTSRIQRFPDDITQMSLDPSYAAGLTDEQLRSDIELIREHISTLTQGSDEYEAASQNLSILESEARSRNLFTPARTGPSPASSERPAQSSIPVDVTFSMSEEDARAFSREAAIGRSLAIGGARSLGYVVSPPIRGFADPFLPLATRLGGGGGPLGELGGAYGAERYISSQFMRDLRPRIYTQAGELALREVTGGSEWLLRYGVRGRDLERLPGLIARMSEGGSLTAAELRLVQTFFRAHAEHGLTFASPAMSATIRPGLSAASDVAPFIREYPYVVRIEVPSSAVGEVNAVLGANRPANLAQELEVLVFTDSRGNVTNIRPNPTSSLGRAAPYLRWGGRVFIVAGAGVSTYRISTATPEERPRVIGEEAGGWAGGLGGAGLATAGCIAFGIATEGIGLVICGLLGAIGGGIGGSALGGEVGEAVGPNPIERAGSWAVDAYTDRMMESPDPVVRQDAVAIRRVVYNDDPFSVMYLMNRFCGGCLNFGF